MKQLIYTFSYIFIEACQVSMWNKLLQQENMFELFRIDELGN